MVSLISRALVACSEGHEVGSGRSGRHSTEIGDLSRKQAD